MCDIFDKDVPWKWLYDLLDIIFRTPNLDWLLLTKRPQAAFECYENDTFPFGVDELDNVWLGVSVEDQERADERLPILCEIPAAVRFVSYEPALESVDFTFWRDEIDWIICGGESGPKARPMHPDWARHVREQCRAADIPFFFKQWGAWGPFMSTSDDGVMYRMGKKEAGRLLDGKEWNEFPVHHGVTEAAER